MYLWKIRPINTIYISAVSTNKQADKQTDRQADKQTDRQADKQTDRQTHTQTDRQIHILFLHFLLGERFPF
jgi:hypothetical protein